MMRRIVKGLLLIGVGLLSACQSGPVRTGGDPAGLFPRGSALVLEQKIDIPGGDASVYLQDRKVKSYFHVNRYKPFCKFEMWSLEEAPRTITPDSFAITEVERNLELVRREGMQLASLDLVGDTRDSGSPMATIVSTVLYLRSERQPDVYRLVCRRWDDLSLYHQLTVADVQDALKGFFTLRQAK